MAGERYWKATISGITGVTFFSYELMCDIVAYLDPADDKRKIATVNNKRASGEVRSEVDFQSKFGTKETNLAVVIKDVAGVGDKTVTFPVAAWTRYKGETGNEDTKPGTFSANLELEVPA
jgi:hypothetical protein